MKLVFLTLTAFLFVIISKLGHATQTHRIQTSAPVAQVEGHR